MLDVEGPKTYLCVNSTVDGKMEITLSVAPEGVKPSEQLASNWIDDTVRDTLSVSGYLNDNQRLAVISLIEKSTLLKALEWCLNDTEVRDDIWNTVRDNEKKVRAIISQSEG